MFEHCKWITKEPFDTPQRPADCPSVLMRRSFTLDKPVLRAKLSICGLGLGEYSINGQKVTDAMLMPLFSRYDKTTYYNVFDVTALLMPGDNAVGAMLGNGMYNDVNTLWEFDKAAWRHHPKLLCKLTVEHPDGTVTTIPSDVLWKCAKGPVLFNHARAGEIYDARVEILGWTDAGFDDDQWWNAVICRGPGGDLLEANVPPIRITNTLPMKLLSSHGKCAVYDAGVNISGWVRIMASGEAGREVTLRFAERLRGDGAIDASNINLFNGDTPMQHTDKYIFSGRGREVWEPRFVYHGFRYVQVENAPDGFEIEARVVHTDLRIIGEFECGDEMLNQIHMAARRATLYNFHGIPTDCPHREQNGWTGDAALSAEQALMNFDMFDSYSKWLKDITDCQRPSGQLPGIAPTSSWGYNWGSGPAWDAALMLIPGYAYDSTGDDQLIRQCWPGMVSYMDFMATMADGCIVNFGLGDWCAPKKTAACDVALTDTAYYYVFAREMARYARLMGEDAAEYERLASEIRAAWRKKFLLNGSISTEGQTAWACAIYQGLLDESEIPEAAKHLAELVEQNDCHVDCGILGAKYIFGALAEHGFQQVLYNMVVNPTSPSYAHWILSGMTTLCESWEMTDSLNHHMFSEVEHWMYKYLAGIRIDEPGYARVHIEPLFVDEVKWVKARHSEISVEWDDEKVVVYTPTPGVLVLYGEEIPLQPGQSVFLRGEQSIATANGSVQHQ